MKIFIVNEGSKAAMTAAVKIASQAKPGAVIPLTPAEFEAVCSGNMVAIETGTLEQVEEPQI